LLNITSRPQWATKTWKSHDTLETTNFFLKWKIVRPLNWPAGDRCRLAHDVTLDNISAVDDADTAGRVCEYNKQSDVYQNSTSSTLLDKLQSRIESRNQRNAAKSRLTSTDAHGEKADTETTQTETPSDKKQKADSGRMAAVCRSPRIEDVADAGLNALSGCGGSSRRRQIADSTVLCRNVELTPPIRVASRLHEIRQRFKSEVYVNHLMGTSKNKITMNDETSDILEIPSVSEALCCNIFACI